MVLARAIAFSFLVGLMPNHISRIVTSAESIQRAKGVTVTLPSQDKTPLTYSPT